MREFLAELLGTFVMIAFGTGVVAQKVFSTADSISAAGSELSINACWGMGVFFGILISGTVSGAHLNPAVSLALIVHGRMSPKKLPHYVAGQMLGAFLASACVYAVYVDALDAYTAQCCDGQRTSATGGVWATYPQAYEGVGAGFLDELFGSTLLLLGIFAISDDRNNSMTPCARAASVGMLVVAIGMAFGYNTGYAINPARDLPPRIFTYAAGWRGSFTDDNHWWWVPCIAPLAGGVLGSTVYQACVGWHWDDDRQNPGAAEESAHKEEDPSQLDTYLLQPSANMV